MCLLVEFYWTNKRYLKAPVRQLNDVFSCKIKMIRRHCKLVFPKELCKINTYTTVKIERNHAVNAFELINNSFTGDKLLHKS